MACNTVTNGIAQECNNNIGGVTKLYIASFGNVSSYTESGGTVSVISMTGSTTFYEFAFNRNSATFTENLVKSVEAGSSLFEQTVTVTIPKRDNVKRNRLAQITVGDLAVVIKDANSVYWYLGATEGLYVSEQNSTSGTAKADGSNWVLTLKGFEQNQAYTLSSASVITSVLGTTT